jgi:hypothetical protein
MRPIAAPDLNRFTSRKVTAREGAMTNGGSDSVEAWIDRYLALAVTGVRSTAVTDKIRLHLTRFVTFFRQLYGHDRLSACMRRDVVAWQTALRAQGLAPFRGSRRYPGLFDAPHEALRWLPSSSGHPDDDGFLYSDAIDSDARAPPVAARRRCT